MYRYSTQDERSSIFVLLSSQHFYSKIDKITRSLMDYTQAKILTEKILNFMQSLEQQDSPVLPMEQMLLQNYAKELYHALGATDKLADSPVHDKSTTSPPLSETITDTVREEVAEVVPIRPDIKEQAKDENMEISTSGKAPADNSESAKRFPEMEKGHIETAQDHVKTQPLNRLQDFIEEATPAAEAREKVEDKPVPKATSDSPTETTPTPDAPAKRPIKKFGPPSRTETSVPETESKSTNFKPSEPIKSFSAEADNSRSTDFKPSEPVKSFKPAESSASQTPPMSRIIPPEIAELFEVTAARDLSEKLGESKLDDISKAMGINEKIFTVNELFDGDHDAFDDTLRKLNAKTSLKQAQDFLARDIAQKFDWADASRQKKAKNFIKLVKRLYA